MPALSAPMVPGSTPAATIAHPVRLMAILLGLYTAQSVVSGIVSSSIPVILRDAGLALDQIGLVSLLTLPWALKIFWAPLIDRYGRTTVWIFACQLCLVMCFLLLGMLNLAAMPLLALPVFVVVVLAAATQDIATDATGIHATTRRSRTLASGASAAGGYLGYLLGGGAWLWVYATYGWRPSMLLAGLILLMLTLPVVFGRDDLKNCSADHGVRLRTSLTSALLRRGLLMMLGWQIAVRLALSLSGTLLVDAGMDLDQIAWIRGALSMTSGFFAALLATVLAQRVGLRPMLHLAAGLFISGCLAHAAWIGGWLGGMQVLIALHMGTSAAISVSFVAIYAAMMGFCDEKRAATDFSILQAFDVLLLVAAGILAGILAENFGYAPVFCLAAALMTLSWPFTIWLNRPRPETSLTYDPE